MKKDILILCLTAILGVTSFSSSALTLEEAKEKPSVKELIQDENQNLKKMFEQNPGFFQTSERIQEDLEIEQTLIEKFNENYFSKKDTFDPKLYNKEMNSFFVDALKTGNRNLADEILFNSGAAIDLNFISDTPKNNPLMAIATSFAYDGGDIEYFIKLVKMGANPSYVTNTNKVSIMSMAAAVDNYKIVLYLAMIGENVMHIDGFDYYPLDYALKNNSNKTMVILTSLINEYTKQLKK